MYLHVGNNKNIRTAHVIGIFDMDNATMSPTTRKYLQRADKDGNAEWAVEDIPKSFILYTEGGKYKVCFSQISASSLRERLKRLPL